MRAEPQEPLGAGAPVNDAPGLRSEDPIELHHRRGRRTEERCDELAELLGCNSLEADVASQAGGEGSGEIRARQSRQVPDRDRAGSAGCTGRTRAADGGGLGEQADNDVGDVQM